MEVVSEDRSRSIVWIEVVRSLGEGGEIYRIRKGQLLPVERRLSQILDIIFLQHESVMKFVSLRRLLPYKLSFSLSIAGYLLRNNPRLIVTTGVPHIEGLVAFAVGKLQRAPILLKETHWYWPNTLLSKVLWPINLWLAKRTTFLVVPGQRVKRYWEKAGVRSGQIVIVPFYTSVLNVDQSSILLSKNLKEKYREKLVILYLGRLIRKKGIDYLIKAYARLRDEISNAVLLIVGDGPDRMNLENQCASLGLTDVEFVGVVSETCKKAYFLLADMYVYPSVTLDTPEEWSLGIIEAMSVGKPVIATSATGCALDAIENGVNGYIVPEADERALYFSMRRIAENVELRDRMGAESKRIADSKFSYDCAVRAMAQAIVEALSRA